MIISVSTIQTMSFALVRIKKNHSSALRIGNSPALVLKVVHVIYGTNIDKILANQTFAGRLHVITETKVSIA